jgi:hypothetical protein
MSKVVTATSVATAMVCFLSAGTAVRARETIDVSGVLRSNWSKSNRRSFWDHLDWFCSRKGVCRKTPLSSDEF